jgi:hypothetical protein
MYIDAANNKIKEPVDYLIEAEKKSRKTAIPLALAGYPELANEASFLHHRILTILNELPIEDWETTNKIEQLNYIAVSSAIGSPGSTPGERERGCNSPTSH